MPGPLRQLAWVIRKDLLIEWRGRARLVAVAAFAVMVILLFSFAVGPDGTTLQQHAPGYVWLAVLTASTALLSQSFQVETETGALEGLLLLPVDHRALYYGKALANLALLLGVATLSMAVGFFLFGLSAREDPAWLVLTLILGCASLAAPGTLYAALTARVAAQQLMLPLLLFPLIVPALVASVKATALALQGDPMQQMPDWLTVLACFDLIYWSLPSVLFAKVVEE
ncbi:MAG: heme exporter protein CcmB [Alphaproteobacteria bacterium]|nr:heme exporter protein CcmB [Alphaproteobacteria bacterium]